MNPNSIQLTHYDYDKNELIEDEVVSVHQVAKSMTKENMAQLLDNYSNSYANHYGDGVKIGEMLQHAHRTGQGCVGRLALGILVGLGNQDFTDARNEKIVALGKQLKRMIEDNELDMGHMI